MAKARHVKDERIQGFHAVQARPQLARRSVGVTRVRKMEKGRITRRLQAPALKPPGLGKGLLRAPALEVEVEVAAQVAAALRRGPFAAGIDVTRVCQVDVEASPV